LGLNDLLRILSLNALQVCFKLGVRNQVVQYNYASQWIEFWANVDLTTTTNAEFYWRNALDKSQWRTEGVWNDIIKM